MKVHNKKALLCFTLAIINSFYLDNTINIVACTSGVVLGILYMFDYIKED